MTRPCQECVDPDGTGCQCSLESSTSVEVTGSGSAGDPFVPAVIIDPASDNGAEVTVDGLYVPPTPYPYCWAYADNDQVRAVADNVRFPVTVHDDGVKAGDGTFKATSTGLWECVAQVEVIRDDDHPFTEVFFGLYDSDNDFWRSKTGPAPWPTYAGTNTFVLVHRVWVEGNADTHYQVRVRAIDGDLTPGAGDINLATGIENTWIYFGKRRA